MAHFSVENLRTCECAKKDRQEILPVTRNVRLSPGHVAFVLCAVLQNSLKIPKHRTVFPSNISVADIVVVVADDLQ